MTVMQSEVFEAFRAIDVPEDKALKAATALSKRDDDVASLKADMTLLKWMVGALAAVTFSVGAPAVWLLIRVAVKVGAVG
jgi:hypothetical protein